MKIIKVIVDKPPDKCMFCEFRDVDYVLPAGIGHVCKIMWEKLGDLKQRPDWCPLITEQQNLIYALSKVRGEK